MNLVRWVQRPRAHAARRRQRQGPPGPVPQPDDAAGVRRAVGAEPGDGHVVRRRLEDQLRADDRRQRDGLQGAPARDVARRRVRRRRSWTSPSCYDIDQLRELGGIVDYTVGPAGVKVFCLAEHTDPKQRHYLELYKMGEGPLYPFWIPYHLVALRGAVLRSRGSSSSATTSRRRSAGPVVEVCAVAKRDLEAGEMLDEYGMYMTYGEAVNAEEMSDRPLPAGGSRRGLPAACARSRRTRSHLRRRRAAAPAPRRTASAPSSTATSAARRGSERDACAESSNP